MTKSFHVLAGGLCLLLLATVPARAATIAENTGGFDFGVTSSTFHGQSFTTGSAAEYANISFNFFDGSNIAYADADQTYLLLGSEYLGRNDGLNTATSGYIASTTGTSGSGNQWVFDPSVRLSGNTEYWLYGTGDMINQFAVDFGDPYSGGKAYHSGGGAANVWEALPNNDTRFTVSGTRLIDPNSFLKVKVDYDTPDVIGPVSFGLTELPASPSATFTLGEGTPDGLGSTVYGLDDVLTANMIFGDGVFTTLTAFEVIEMNGIIETMSYTFAPQDTPTAEGIIILNFPLTITGTDIASGQAFSYTYANSTETLTNIPEPATMTLLAVGGLMLARCRTKRDRGRPPVQAPPKPLT